MGGAGTSSTGFSWTSWALEVDADDLGQHHPHVLVALEDRAQRIGDLARRQRAGGDLVGERLEQVEVPPVDQGDLDRRAAELVHGLDAAEAATDHHHAVHDADATGDRSLGAMRPNIDHAAQRICMPEIAREMTRRWISEVPSKIV